MSPLELVDDRFGELARELRASQPRASAELRERIETLAPPSVAPNLPSLRRLAPAVALGCSGRIALRGGRDWSRPLGLPRAPSRRARETPLDRAGLAAHAGRHVTLFPSPGRGSRAGGQALLRQLETACSSTTPPLTLRVNDADELSTPHAARRCGWLARSAASW